MAGMNTFVTIIIVVAVILVGSTVANSAGNMQWKVSEFIYSIGGERWLPDSDEEKAIYIFNKFNDFLNSPERYANNVPDESCFIAEFEYAKDFNDFNYYMIVEQHPTITGKNVLNLYKKGESGEFFVDKFFVLSPNPFLYDLEMRQSNVENVRELEIGGRAFIFLPVSNLKFKLLPYAQSKTKSQLINKDYIFSRTPTIFSFRTELGTAIYSFGPPNFPIAGTAFSELPTCQV